MKTITFEISDEAYDLLQKLGNGYAEYRDTEYQNEEEFLQSDVYKTGKRNLQWFLDRNFGGTYLLMNELAEYGLVDSDYDSWHLTFQVTDLGKRYI